MKPKNLLSGIPASIPEEVFETIIQSDKIHIERILSQGHSTPNGEWLEEAQNEWVIVLQGSAGIQFDNQEEMVLNVGDYLLIPSYQKHRVTWTDTAQTTIWLAIYY